MSNLVIGDFYDLFYVINKVNVYKGIYYHMFIKQI